MRAQTMKRQDAFSFGIVDNSQVIAQYEYLKPCKKRTSEVGLISQLIRQVWQLQFRMQDHRNKILHVVNKDLYIDKRQVVDRAIRTEFILGLNGLENNMTNFFSRNVDKILKALVNMKMQQLESDLSARDKLRED